MKQYVGCLIRTHDNKILLQQRGDDWGHYPGYLSEFGGHLEAGETPMQALIRELKEELGAEVKANEVVDLGTVVDESSDDSELVYVFFWHDVNATITGCYEGEPRKFDSLDDVFKHPKVMGSVRWLLAECRNRGYL